MIENGCSFIHFGVWGKLAHLVGIGGGGGGGGGAADVATARCSCTQQVKLSADSYCTACTIVRGST